MRCGFSFPPQMFFSKIILKRNRCKIDTPSFTGLDCFGSCFIWAVTSWPWLFDNAQLHWDFSIWVAAGRDEQMSVLDDHFPDPKWRAKGLKKVRVVCTNQISHDKPIRILWGFQGVWMVGLGGSIDIFKKWSHIFRCFFPSWGSLSFPFPDFFWDFARSNKNGTSGLNGPRFSSQTSQGVYEHLMPFVHQHLRDGVLKGFYPSHPLTVTVAMPPPSHRLPEVKTTNRKSDAVELRGLQICPL